MPLNVRYNLGRPRTVDPKTLAAVASNLYFDLRQLAARTLSFDREEYLALVDELDKIDFGVSVPERTLLQRLAEKRLQGTDAPGDGLESELNRLQEDFKSLRYLALRELLVEECTDNRQSTDGPEILSKVLEANTPEELRKVCAQENHDHLAQIPVISYGIDSPEQTDFPPQEGPEDHVELFVTDWPRGVRGASSPLRRYLMEHAEQFVAAKTDPRFPRSNRPTNRLKQLWFLSRALAGAVFGISTRTAIDMVRAEIPKRRQAYKEWR